MEKKDLISIIIPVYNAEKYLSRCIDSILPQHFFELILVNDGSRDNSGDICDKYALKDNRIKVIHQTNKGVSVARNAGIDKSEGEWIAFVDADDWVENNWIESISKHINCNQSVDMFTFGFHRIDGDCKVNSYHTIDSSIIDGYIYLKSYYYPSCWVCVFKASIVKLYNIYFPVGIKQSEDQAFLMQYLSVCEKIVPINAALYNYYNNVESVTNQSVNQSSEPYNLMVTIELLKFCNKHNIKESFKNDAARILYDGFFQFYNSRADKKERKRIQKEYRRFYKKTIELCQIFKKNKIFKFGTFNLLITYLLLQRKRRDAWV